MGAVQKDLARLEKWADRNIIKSSKVTCKAEEEQMCAHPEEPLRRKVALRLGSSGGCQVNHEPGIYSCWERPVVS